MSFKRCALPIALAFACAATVAARVHAAEQLPCQPEIVAGEVLGSSLERSADGSTYQAVRIAPRKVWRSDISESEITVELAAAKSPRTGAKSQLNDGRVYVLFLERSTESGRLVVRTDGVYEVVGTANGPRVVPQAKSTLLGSAAFRQPQGLTLDGLTQVIQNVIEDPCGGGGGGGGGGGTPPCIPDGGVDDTLYQTHCCSGFAVNGSTVCSNPSDYGTTWASCYHVCGTAPVNGCIPSGGIDDTLYSTHCCSGSAVSGSTWCLNWADYGTTWASCVQVCA